MHWWAWLSPWRQHLLVLFVLVCTNIACTSSDIGVLAVLVYMSILSTPLTPRQRQVPLGIRTLYVRQGLKRPFHYGSTLYIHSARGGGDFTDNKARLYAWYSS